MDREAAEIIADMKSSWLRLGSLIQRMIDTQAVEVLGFRSMRSWMEARLGESSASAYSALRSVRALQGVPNAKLAKIGERNAHALTHLPEKERKSEDWLEKAAVLPTKDFKQEVETALSRKTGLPRDKFKTWWIALPENVYEDMCAAEKKLAFALSLDIENIPGLRIQVWEAWAQWILQTDEQTIKVQTEGME